MPERTIITRDYLRRLRNEIDFNHLLRYLRWPHQQTDGKLTFVCPDCSEITDKCQSEDQLSPMLSL